MVKAIDGDFGRGRTRHRNGYSSWENSRISTEDDDRRREQASNQALQLAVQDAAGQAKIMVGALGVSITGVVSVVANPSYPSPIVYDASGESSVSTPVIAPQSLQITASAQVVYAIS